MSLGAEVQLEVRRGGAPLNIMVVPQELVIPAQDDVSFSSVRRIVALFH